MRQIRNVQGLRGLAISLVIVAHEHNFLDRFHVHSFLRTFATVESWGVDLFFVISGFVMVSAHWNDFGARGAPVRFLARRIIRIFPMYWLVTLVVFAAVKLVPSEVHAWPTVHANLLLSLALLVPRSQPVLLWLGWTLVFEMYFYYVFAATLVLARRTALVVIGAWSAMLVAFQFGPSPHDAWIATLTDGIAIEFVFGMVAGALVVNRRLLPSWAAFAGIATACVLLAITYHITYNPADELSTIAPFRFFSVGLPMALLAYGAACVELRGGLVVPRPLRSIGDASYSIYLTHPLFYVALTRVAVTFHGRVPGPGLIVLGLVVVLLGGLAVYRFVERPLLAISRRELDRTFPRIMHSASPAHAASVARSAPG